MPPAHIYPSLRIRVQIRLAFRCRQTHRFNNLFTTSLANVLLPLRFGPFTMAIKGVDLLSSSRNDRSVETSARSEIGKLERAVPQLSGVICGYIGVGCARMIWDDLRWGSAPKMAILQSPSPDSLDDNLLARKHPFPLAISYQDQPQLHHPYLRYLNPTPEAKKLFSNSQKLFSGGLRDEREEQTGRHVLWYRRVEGWEVGA
jgi:hypothetical protein